MDNYESDLKNLENDLQLLKEIDSEINDTLKNNNLCDQSFINMDKLIEITSDVDKAIIDEQFEDIKKVEHELNDLMELVNEVNEIIVSNKDDLQIVEDTTEEVEKTVESGVSELKEASTYVDLLTHKNTKIIGTATIVGLATGGVGYLFGSGAIIASGIAVATGATTGIGTKAVVKKLRL